MIAFKITLAFRFNGKGVKVHQYTTDSGDTIRDNKKYARTTPRVSKVSSSDDRSTPVHSLVAVKTKSCRTLASVHPESPTPESRVHQISMHFVGPL